MLTDHCCQKEKPTYVLNRFSHYLSFFQKNYQYQGSDNFLEHMYVSTQLQNNFILKSVPQMGWSGCNGSEAKKHCKRFVLEQKLTWDQKSLIGTNPSHFFSPGMAQWWEHSPPTSVAWVQILASMPYVGWVCCWFSPLLRELFLHFQIPIQPESGRQRTTFWMCYLQIITQRRFT